MCTYEASRNGAWHLAYMIKVMLIRLNLETKNQSTDSVKMHFFWKFKTHEIDILQSFSFASQVESDVVTVLMSYTSRLLAQNSSKEAKLLSIAQRWWMVDSCPTFPPGPWAWRWSGHEAAGRARSPGWGKEVLPLWWCCRSRPRLCCPTWWRRWPPLQHANAVYNLARYKNLKFKNIKIYQNLKVDIKHGTPSMGVKMSINNNLWLSPIVQNDGYVVSY